MNPKEKRNLLLSVVALVAFAGLSAWLTNVYVNRLSQNETAQAATTTLSAAINAGTLSISAPGSATMSAVNMDSVPDSGTTSTGTITGVKVSDHRGGAPGWSATATCSNFSDGGTNTIAVTNLSITPGSVSAVGNSSLTGITAGSSHTFTGASDPASMMSASAGNGRGRYTQDESLSLFVDVSVVPATYTATVTETVA